MGITPSDIQLTGRVAVVTGGDGGTQAAGGWYRHPQSGEFQLGSS
jgi:hypothetical protein